MNKEAIAAKSLLKALTSGKLGKSLAIGSIAGGTGGGAYLGHKVGYKSGATRATNEMASAFSEANATENQQIRDSFNSFNKQENASIADNYMRRGMALGAQLHAAGKIKFPSEMSKKSSVTGEDINKQAYLEEIYNEAFNDELEKCGAPVNLIGMGVRSFKRLGKGLKTLGSHAKRVINPGEGMTRGAAVAKMGRSALSTAKNSQVALGTLGAGAYTLS